jgi:dGTPase
MVNMEEGLFSKVSSNPQHSRWKICIHRLQHLYYREDDIRTPFLRDYNRILHCTAYRRLKHKTQVFFAPTNDHICTRIEHVNHVAAVSYTIAKYLGLNTELTNAIAIGHDLGHAPFGHAGESIIKEIVERELNEAFWHEKNSLWFVDKCETLEDPQGHHRNLNLTYAVRDGIVCHCGEVDENSICPRDNSLDLLAIEEPNQYQPYTWEGCVAKIADKIAYLGRDIEDAMALKILTPSQVKELVRIVRPFSKGKIKQLNNTVVMHEFIIDLCRHSSPENGIKISGDALRLMNSIKQFNYRNIYYHSRLNTYREYAKLIIDSIYETLKGFYQKEDTLKQLKRYSNIYPTLTGIFSEWLLKYACLEGRPVNFQNAILYDLNQRKDYSRAILDFISGMTDMFAIKIFDEITSF